VSLSRAHQEKNGKTRGTAGGPLGGVIHVTESTETSWIYTLNNIDFKLMAASRKVESLWSEIEA